MMRLSGPVKFWGLHVPLLLAMCIVATLHLVNLAIPLQIYRAQTNLVPRFLNSIESPFLDSTNCLLMLARRRV